ncbi:hypothetical protein [Agrococcus sp. KRD186]|uniref:hypothetical protein n=1 Tax=Agrococcus sp. KRD186 TaxID=2729730 RepID=UPI0019D25C1B|nr:hypothetical protein [Agrococcus sp. KRD186]
MTVELLSRPLDWRVRVVEEIVVESATSCLRSRSLQVSPLRRLLRRHVRRNATHALLAMNVAPMPRGPLLDFSVEGPEGSGWLLPRVEIAERQALYLESLAKQIRLETSPQLHGLLVAICGFTGEWIGDSLDRATLERYLELGVGEVLPKDAVAAWREVADACRAVLRPFLDVFKGYSAPEDPALVIPEILEAGVISNFDEATALLGEYRELIERLHRHHREHDGSPGLEFLRSLADYANHFDLMVALKVPLDEPFLVKIEDRRALKLTALRNTGDQELVVADAQTNHVTFKVPDPNVRIAAFSARVPGSPAFAQGAFHAREDEQGVSLYAHETERDYRIRLVFKLAPLARLRVVPWFASLLLFLLTAALLVDQPTDLRTLALITGPAALGASILLVREASTLGSRLRLLASVAVLVALTCLTLASVWLFVIGMLDASGADQVKYLRS